MKPIVTLLAAGAALTTLASGAYAKADIGVLTCKLTDAKNVVVYTKEEFACEFKPNGGGEVQKYTGVFKELGVNLSVSPGVTLVWGVLSPSKNPGAPGSLAGHYYGGTASVELGVGGAANVLVGGGKDSFTLQPISVSGIVGAGAALDVGEFELK